jgi:hypothetical protein
MRKLVVSELDGELGRSGVGRREQVHRLIHGPRRSGRRVRDPRLGARRERRASGRRGRGCVVERRERQEPAASERTELVRRVIRGLDRGLGSALDRRFRR